jgi:hypothetical protein
MNELRTRKPNRLNDYDYSQSGYYFVTICTKDRAELLGEIMPVVGATVPGRPPSPVARRSKNRVCLCHQLVPALMMPSRITIHITNIYRLIDT